MNGELGRAGLSEWSGVIQEDFLADLRGTRGYARFNEMRLNCPIIAAELTAIESSVRSLQFRVANSQEDENDPRVAFLDYALENMSHSINDHISEVLTMLPFGWSLFESVYKQVEEGEYSGLWTWRKFAIRGQNTLYKWELDETGGLKAFWQQAAPSYIPIRIPIEKCLLYRTRVEKNNPEGRSILRASWLPYYFWKNISQIEAIGIERDIAGMPTVTLPQNATSEDKANAEKFVRNVRNDEQSGAVIPFGWVFELMASSGTRLFDTDKVINRYENRMLMASLAQFLMLGAEGEGSLALSQDQTSFWAIGVNAVADVICEVMTKYAIPRLLALNGWDAENISFTHSPAGEQDLSAIGTFLGQVTNLLTWTPQDEQWLRDIAKLPEVDEEIIIAERERKEEIQAKIQAAFGGSKNDPKEEKERLSASIHELNNRKLWEGRLQRLIKGFFPGQKNRILKGAMESRKRAYPFG